MGGRVIAELRTANRAPAKFLLGTIESPEIWRWQGRFNFDEISAVEPVPSDYDGAWKETLEKYWPPFLSLCFPNVAADIDWTKPFEFLDKELQEVTRDADSGRRFVDKLVKVVRKSGDEQWVLVHVEVQSDPVPDLPARMYQYYFRLTDRYPHPVASLAVLADDHPTWIPGPHLRELWGCRVYFEYLTCKLLNLTDDYLEQVQNPVALVIAAQRAAQRTVGDLHRRKRLKLELVRQLYARGFEKKDVLELLRLIDWQIALPGALENAFRNEVGELEKVNNMPYVTSFERLSREEGIQSGRLASAQESITEALQVRFGTVPTDISEILLSTTDLPRLRAWLRLAITVPSIEAFAAAIANNSRT